MQFLSGLCALSIQSAQNSVNQLLSSLLITSRLLSEATFETQINSSIEESQTEARRVFFRLFFLLRNVLDGNEITSSYGTDFKYVLPWYMKSISAAITEGMIYDQCSCELNKTCTSQANFIGRNSSKLIEIKGLKMGCTPSESLLRSTLECFYDLSCIDILDVGDLVNNVFIEKCPTTINYSAYFDQCLPALRSYQYIEQIDSLYTVTLLLSIYGGLSVVLKWICPLIVLLAAKLYRRWKTRHLRVHHIGASSCFSSNVYVCSFRKAFVFGCLIFALVLVAIILPSLYIFQSKNKQNNSKGTFTVARLTMHH